MPSTGRNYRRRRALPYRASAAPPARIPACRAARSREGARIRARQSPWRGAHSRFRLRSSASRPLRELLIELLGVAQERGEPLARRSAELAETRGSGLAARQPFGEVGLDGLRQV